MRTILNTDYYTNDYFSLESEVNPRTPASGGREGEERGGEGRRGEGELEGRERGGEGRGEEG